MTSRQTKLSVLSQVRAVVYDEDDYGVVLLDMITVDPGLLGAFAAYDCCVQLYSKNFFQVLSWRCERCQPVLSALLWGL
jgi:hypothetical protein